jgi:hypothetical protein
MIQKQPCALGRNHQPPFRRNEKKFKVKHLGEFYHVDACVMSIKSHGEAKCFLLLKNDHIFYRVLYCMKIVQHFEHLCIEFEANELKNCEMIKGENLFWESLIISSKKGIRQDLAVVYTLEKIDVIDKDNKTIVKRIGCMILSKILSIRL